MNLTSTIFLSVISLLIGAGIGSLIESTLKKRPSPPPPLPTSDKKLAEDGDIEVFSAWRTSTNKVWLNMDGTRLDSREALMPDQRRRLLSLVVDLRPWLETLRPASPEPGTAPQPLPSAAPVSKVAFPAPQAGEKLSAGVAEALVPAPAQESIIEQIDKVLQVKLAVSPFKERGIKLTEGPGGIVLIKDGANRYEGVEAVPDPTIKTLIRQAVTDWEKGTR